MSDRDFGTIVGGLVLLVVLVAVFVYSHYSEVADCASICRTRGTVMVDVTHYGCLCADGSLAAEPERHSTTVIYSGGGR